MNVFLANLPYTVTEDEVRAFFNGVCPVHTVRLAYDGATKKFRGFAFVDVGDAVEVAIKKLDRVKLSGRTITVAKAKGGERGTSNARPKAKRGGGPSRERREARRGEGRQSERLKSSEHDDYRAAKNFWGVE